MQVRPDENRLTTHSWHGVVEIPEENRVEITGITPDVEAGKIEVDILFSDGSPKTKKLSRKPEGTAVYSRGFECLILSYKEQTGATIYTLRADGPQPNKRALRLVRHAIHGSVARHFSRARQQFEVPHQQCHQDAHLQVRQPTSVAGPDAQTKRHGRAGCGVKD
jgi:hypothetical protein